MRSFLPVRVRSIRSAGNGESIRGGGGDDQDVIDHCLAVVEQEISDAFHKLFFLCHLLDDASGKSDEGQKQEISRACRCQDVSVGPIGGVCGRTTHRIEIGRTLEDLGDQCETPLHWCLREA